MSTSATPALFPATVAAKRSESAVSLPWYTWLGALAVTSASIGGAWDVSWHRSIGRDSFWTPAHMAIYLCGVLGGIIGMVLVVQATTGRDAELRAQSISVFGLRAPLGVFLAGWGGVAMLTSAPFDNWWHNAYGLDVKIVSPPHTLLILGIRMISIGILFLVLAAMNRASAAGAANHKALQRMFLYVAGLAVGGTMFFLQEFNEIGNLHRALPYIATAIGVPVMLATFSQASRYRWAATATASVYTLFLIAEILILPLFPAQPKLGPVFYPVTHMVPAQFPMLILAPAIALDLLWNYTKSWKIWQIAVVSGVVFTAVLVVVEWPFAKFLLSPASRNRFFGTGYFDYLTRANDSDVLGLFWHPTHGAELAKGLVIAVVCGMVSTALGLVFGRWMRGVQR